MRPARWYPGEVVNPDGEVDGYFTDSTAWEFIASRLEAGEKVTVIKLKKPPSKKGYVMNIDLGPRLPKLYVKLELGSKQVFGRSFHFSEDR